MDMKLQFETQPELTEGFELPMLVDVGSIHHNELAEGLLIDGAEVSLDDAVLRRAAYVVGAIQDEVLPKGHFRDCVSFTMAMCGIWLPTHKPFDAAYTFTQVCNESTTVDNAILGPVATGIPKDESCLGFEDMNFIYSHMAYGAETSKGNLFLYKGGVEPEYFISTMGGIFEWYRHTVAHRILEARVTHRENGELAHWSSALAL